MNMEEKVRVTFKLGKQQATIKVFQGTQDYMELPIPVNAWDYGTIVSTIIRSKYSSDSVEAIVNNYLLDPEDETAATEMQQFQAFRAAAKIEAQSCIDYVEENHLWVHQEFQ